MNKLKIKKLITSIITVMKLNILLVNYSSVVKIMLGILCQRLPLNAHLIADLHVGYLFFLAIDKVYATFSE